MAANNQFISNFRESSTENNVDLGVKFVTKEYLIDVYPYLSGLGNIQFAGLWTWGYNNNGQLGDNSITSRSSPIQTIAWGSNWKQVSCGYHTVAIKTDGTLWGWGRNTAGQLGDNTVANKSSPVQTVAFGTNWKQVAAGRLHTGAIKTDGTLWTWGRNGLGQLGDNSTTDRSSPVQTVAFGNNWKQVACGYSYTSAIKTDGTLWSWGRNVYGQLGNNTANNTSSPVQTVSAGTNWKQVSCGYTHSGAIKTDGTLWSWGRNNFGQLGDNSITNRSSPVQTVSAGTNWKQVACGYSQSGAIKTDGTLWTWGVNVGNLGDNTVTHRSSPVQTIALGSNWKQVDVGYYIAGAIKTDGTLWNWGDNNTGQLGDNSITNRSSPVQTVAFGNNWKQIYCGYYFTTAIKEMGDDF
jgi:alpha-tubulin suppressor-like RCC1 family protein